MNFNKSSEYNPYRLDYTAKTWDGGQYGFWAFIEIYLLFLWLPFGIIAYAVTRYLNNLCRNSCIHLPYIGDRTSLSTKRWPLEPNSLNWCLNVNWSISDSNKDPFGGVWIGLNDVTKEGKFLWTDGSHVTYTNWASSQPDNRKDYENCVEIAVHGGSWTDTSCGRQLPFICEKEN